MKLIFFNIHINIIYKTPSQECVFYTQWQLVANPTTLEVGNIKFLIFINV